VSGEAGGFEEDERFHVTGLVTVALTSIGARSYDEESFFYREC
jgi:hypothetical protein